MSNTFPRRVHNKANHTVRKKRGLDLTTLDLCWRRYIPGEIVDKPDIGLIFDERISSELFEDFESSIKSDSLNFMVKSREPAGAMACPEWFIFPVITAFIGKSYFDGFLKEMGKDHYQTLKEGLASLTTKVMPTPRIEPTLNWHTR